MNESYFVNVSDLDYIRISEGNESCKKTFLAACKKSKRGAAALLNDQRLTFPCLYLLLPQVASFQLDQLINLRNRTAIRIVSHIQESSKPVAGASDLSNKNSIVYAALRWMLQTGYTEDISMSGYEEILDITVSVLINAYADISILPQVAELIFMRHRAGRNIHDLVWAFMRSRDPQVLKLIAARLCSANEHDVKLASSLLNLSEKAAAGGEQYEAFISWLSDNDPFLYFTDNSFQFASNPAFYNIDLERKYLQKGTPLYTKQPIIPNDEEEDRCLETFRSFADEEKALLAEYSHRLHRQDSAGWESWMKRPAEEQIAVAKMEQGVAKWL